MESGSQSQTKALTDDELEHEELKVTFHPQLFLQRRMWVLGELRRENATRVLDVGCGEGELLFSLTQPAPWLPAPPPSILPPASVAGPESLLSPISPSFEDPSRSLHIAELHGLDISEGDLEFAVKQVVPPQKEENVDPWRSWTEIVRWEELVAKVWKGGLENINEEFVDMECIVGSEVIEHLPPNIFEAFVPMILGVYHPQLFLVTTPSYTFNARFTSPDAPPSARKGHPDPTGRTDRVFRHSDHQFEWTWPEFKAWCETTAAEWGYAVRPQRVGLPVEVDPYGRDDELGGASCVASFHKLGSMSDLERERKGRARIEELGHNKETHQLLCSYQHSPHPAARQPKSLEEIAARVKEKMEESRESFMRLATMWYEKDISEMCGGWIEFLIRAVEESADLTLVREFEGRKTSRDDWNIELIGGLRGPVPPWTIERGRSVDYIPPDWAPDEEVGYDSMESDDPWRGVDGDVSAETSDGDADVESEDEVIKDWGKAATWTGESGIGSEDNDKNGAPWNSINAWAMSDIPNSALSSTAGWDGDESDDTTG